MTTYGLTDQGFVIKPLEAIQDEIAAEQKAKISPTLNTEADSLLGNFNGIFAAKLREVWELAQATNAATDPNAATGRGLTEDGLLTGTRRYPATPTRTYGRMQVAASTTIAAGQIASVGVGGARFVSKAAAVNSTGSTAWVEGVLFEAEAAGPVPCNAHTLTTIVTSASGWLAVDNNDDATTDPNTLGTDEETDAALRDRRETELRALGGSNIDSVRAALMEVPDVVTVRMFENETDITDGDGLEPHSFESVVRLGTDAAVAAAIWKSKPAGNRTHGTTTVATPGEDGASHNVKFTRPTVKDVYETVYVSIDAANFPADGDDQIKAAVAAYGATLTIGDDVILAAQYSRIFGVSGVLDVTQIKAGFTASPTGVVNLAIAARELAALDTSRVVVIHV